MLREKITMNNDPQFIKTFFGYNVVAYKQWFWAIPQSLGNIKLEKIELSEYPDILSGTSQDELEITIFTTWIAHNNPTAPTLFRQVYGYNLVAFQGNFFAIPLNLGDIQLENVNVTQTPEILINTHLDNLYDQVVEKDCKQRVNQPPHLAMSINQHNIVYYNKTFFAVPKHLGHVEIDKDAAHHKSILQSDNLSVLKNKLLSESRNHLQEFLRPLLSRIGLASA